MHHSRLLLWQKARDERGEETATVYSFIPLKIEHNMPGLGQGMPVLKAQSWEAGCLPSCAMFSGGWITTSPSARFMPCVPWAAMRKYSWKSPLILQWGQGSWLIYGAAHMASSEVTLHNTLSMRRSARVKVRVILRRNRDCDQTTPCRVFWRSHGQ